MMQPHDPDSGPEWLAARSTVYRLVARSCRREPDADFGAALRSAPLRSPLDILGFPEEISASLALDPDRMESLSIEFCRLFIGPGPLVPPYESMHRSDPGNGRLWGEATVTMKRFVESLGLSYRGDASTLPDHISIELELMARLIEAEAEAISRGDQPQADISRQVQAELFHEHLGRWLAQFAQKLKEVTNEPFYKTLADLISEFLWMESTCHPTTSSCETHITP